ncbi:MAG: SprB repeat-containing protein [Saprospiraceae bacterium]
MPNFYREQILLLLLAFLLNLSDTTAQVNIARLHNPCLRWFSSGHITAIPIGGSAPYTYLWSAQVLLTRYKMSLLEHILLLLLIFKESLGDDWRTNRTTAFGSINSCY